MIAPTPLDEDACHAALSELVKQVSNHIESFEPITTLTYPDLGRDTVPTSKHHWTIEIRPAVVVDEEDDEVETYGYVNAQLTEIMPLLSATNVTLVGQILSQPHVVMEGHYRGISVALEIHLRPEDDEDDEDEEEE